MKENLFRSIAVISLLALPITSASAFTEQPSDRLGTFPRHQEPSHVEARMLGDNVKVRVDEYGAIRSVLGPNGLRLPDQSQARDNPGLVRSSLATTFGFVGSEALFDPKVIDVSEGSSFLRFQQKIAGIPVVGSALGILYDGSGNATALFSHLATDGKLPRAADFKKQDLDKLLKAQFPNGESENTRLVYLLTPDNQVLLSWEVSVRIPGDALRLYVDAQTGSIIEQSSTSFHAKSRRVYSANHTNDMDNELLITEGGSSSNNHAMKAYQYAGEFYDFLASKHQMDSYDDNGRTIQISVDYRNKCTAWNTYGCTEWNEPWNNAQFWAAEGEWFRFGDGDGIEFIELGTDPDVVSHEITHGVTYYMIGENTFASNEGNAINESISDIYAAMFDIYRFGENSNTWKWGEYSYIAGDASRYLNNPSLRSSAYRDFYPDRDPDNPSGHYNSGIVSLAVYLMTKGGTHPQAKSSVQVNGIGINRARNLVHRVISSNCFTRNIDIEGLRYCMQDNAAAMWGAGSTYRQSVEDAFDAVCAPPACAPPAPPATPGWINATSQMCFGLYSTSWASSSGTETYQLWHSSNGDFPNGSVMYTGSGTSANPNIPSSGYLGVRACNSGGCSGFKSTGYLQRSPGCW